MNLKSIVLMFFSSHAEANNVEVVNFEKSDRGAKKCLEVTFPASGNESN